MQDEDAERFERTYLAETHQLLLERVRFAFAIGCVLYLGFWLLDLYVLPNQATTFLGIRMVVVLCAAAAIWLTYLPRFSKSLVPMSVAVLAIASIGLSVMTTYMRGFSSDYFIGNLLVLFFVGLFLPWSLAATLTLSFVACSAYFVLNLLAHGPSAAMVSSGFFLVGTSALTCYATVARERSRKQDLALRLKLERAYEELQRHDELKTRFFANVSHELRTPLMLILGPVDSLLRNPAEGDPRPLLATVAANAQRLLRQVNMLLDFARFDVGRLNSDFTEQNLGQVLEELVWAARPYASRRGIELRSEGLDRLPDSLFDRKQIETVAANLLSNALKFTPSQGRVTVRAAATQDDLVFEVEDTGVGIPGEEHSAIFDRFHQVERESEEAKPGGTGLGLALARELIGLHSGTISVESEVGEGTTFRVCFPQTPAQASDRRRGNRRKEDRMAQVYYEAALTRRYHDQPEREILLADADVRSVEPDAAEPVLTGPMEGPRILVVEDNPELRSFLVHTLSGTYQVEAVRNGVQGLKAARRHTPDLVVSDVMMPRMNGYELCAKMREDSVLASVPVILLTARAGAEAAIEGLRAGADDYVVKPFDMRELEARIAAHIRAKTTERTLHERESRLAAIGQITGSVVHDLRGPLSAIVGHTELAQVLASQTDALQFLGKDLEAVKAAAHRAVNMIQEVVEFARDGSVTLKREEHRFDLLIRKIAEEHRERLAAADIDLVVECDGDCGVVALDTSRMQRVLENLVNNARDALLSEECPEEPMRIVLQVSQDRDRVVLAVIDNGPGIPAELGDRLFQPLATARRRQGTGFGLSIVRNLVAAHGGTVAVEPGKEGRGTTFLIRLPTVGGGAQPAETSGPSAAETAVN